MRNNTTNTTNTTATKSIADEAMVAVPVTKKAAVEAFHRLQAAQGVTYPAPRNVALSALVCWGFDGTVGGLRKALKALANEDSVKTRLEAVKLPAADDVKPVEVETPAKEESGADAAVATTPVAVVKVDEEPATAEESAPAKSDADTDTATDEPAENAPVEKPAEEVADELIWRAEVPRMKALKLLAMAFTGKDTIENGELLDLLKDGKTPLPDFKERLSDAETVDLTTLHEMLIESARMGADIRKLRWIGGQA